MRKIGKVLLLTGILFLTGCTQQADAHQHDGADIVSSLNLKSKVSSEECCICGKSDKSLMGYYRKMDSVGVVCLNTMNICNTDVRVYDDDGKEQFDGNSSTVMNSYGEGECSVIVSGNPNRGISDVQLSYGEKSTPDFDALQKMLCQNCLDKVAAMYEDEMEWDEDGRFPDACLVDFTTNELYSLGSHLGAYYIRDYYVNIEHEDDGDNLLIFYAPERK